MSQRYKFTQEQIAELTSAKAINKNKNVDKRLEALLMRSSNVRRALVSQKTGLGVTRISELTALYQQKGLSAIVENHYTGNHRNLSFAEEAELLEPFMQDAMDGKQVEVSAILKAYEEKLGRTFEKDHGRIYRVLKRHGFRKVMPRSRHPKKASPEAIEASKKLTLVSKKWNWEI